MSTVDSFGTRSALQVGGQSTQYFSLPALEKKGFPEIARLPYSLKILLENLLRHEDGRFVKAADVEALARWDVTSTAQREISTDWIAAYKRHLDTDRPLRDYAALPLTERDGDLLRSELEELGIGVDAGRSDGATLMATLRAARQ